MPAETGDRRQPGDDAGDLDDVAATAAAASDATVTERGRTSPEGDQAEPPQRHPYDPRAWALWQRPKRFIAFLFAMEAIGIAIMVIATMNSTAPAKIDLVRFAILAVGATAHIQLTQRQEERRRDRSHTVLIDLTAVWTFPAAVILPLSLTLSIIALVRIQHWFIARRPAHNFVFSSVTHGVSVTLASLTFAAFGPHEWGRISGWGTLGEFGVLIITGMVFEAVQIAYIGGILTLGSPKRPSVSTVLGNAADNLLEAITIGLGAVTAVLLLIMPPMVIVMAVVTVVFNRLAEIDQLQNDARTDPKTGVLNMRGWSESAERALGRTARSDDNLALLMIDLDHFKWINDTYGHPAGDDVLRDVARKLDEVTRPADVIGRFGGEEFLVLLPDIDETAAKLAAERVRSAIAELHIVTTDKRGSRVTISGRTTSIGAALFPRHGESLEELLHAADAAVYVAKENGRNQVRFAQDVERPAPPEDPATHSED